MADKAWIWVAGLMKNTGILKPRWRSLTRAEFWSAARMTERVLAASLTRCLIARHTCFGRKVENRPGMVRIGGIYLGCDGKKRDSRQSERAGTSPQVLLPGSQKYIQSMLSKLNRMKSNEASGNIVNSEASARINSWCGNFRLHSAIIFGEKSAPT